MQDSDGDNNNNNTFPPRSFNALLFTSASEPFPGVSKILLLNSSLLASSCQGQQMVQVVRRRGSFLEQDDDINNSYNGCGFQQPGFWAEVPKHLQKHYLELPRHAHSGQGGAEIVVNAGFTLAANTKSISMSALKGLCVDQPPTPEREQALALQEQTLLMPFYERSISLSLSFLCLSISLWCMYVCIYI